MMAIVAPQVQTFQMFDCDVKDIVWYGIEFVMKPSSRHISKDASGCICSLSKLLGYVVCN